MNERRNPRVGVISNSNLQRLALSQAVKGHGYELGLNSSLERLDPSVLGQVDLDVLLVDMQEEDDEVLDRLLDYTTAPILFGMEQAPAHGTRLYPRWERRVFVKLQETVGEPVLKEHLDELQDAPAPSAPEQPITLPSELLHHVPAESLEFVVVLAASLGGPAAVKEFLDALPKGLPVAFVLAQHIDSRMQDTLAHVLVRHNGIPCKVAAVGDNLAHGEVLVAPVLTEIDFGQRGDVLVRNRRWDGPYTPSIDQVLANITRRFGPRSGAIIFSGMGSDGAISGPMMADAGGFVWGQSAETCACSSQPDSMRATGCVSFNGSPADLARHLVEYVQAMLATAA